MYDDVETGWCSTIFNVEMSFECREGRAEIHRQTSAQDNNKTPVQRLGTCDTLKRRLSAHRQSAL